MFIILEDFIQSYLLHEQLELSSNFVIIFNSQKSDHFSQSAFPVSFRYIEMINNDRLVFTNIIRSIFVVQFFHQLEGWNECILY